MFDAIIAEVHGYAGARPRRVLPAGGGASWPVAEKGELVLLSDLALELGHPADGSVSFLAWTHREKLVHDGRITLIGPDIGESPQPRLPFGKVVLVRAEGMDEGNGCARHRELTLLKFDLSLKGYMLKAASHAMAEWSRVSREAVAAGFSFSVLGEALMQRFRRLDYVTGVEVLFVTRSIGDVMGLHPMGAQVARRVGAMNRRSQETEHDCPRCGFKDVCDGAGALRQARAGVAAKG